jgi:hypothetical protein
MREALDIKVKRWGRSMRVWTRQTIEEGKITQQRWQLRQLLNQLKPILSLPISRENCEIMSLVSHYDLPLYLTAIKSFYYHTQKQYAITVVDDGSLTKSDVRGLKQFVRGLRFLSKEEVESLIEPQIRNYKNIVEIRSKYPEKSKHIDLPLLCSKSKLYILDSDIIFFQNPSEIVNFLDNEAVDKVMFMSDYQNGYALTKIEAERLFSLNLVPRLNGGLLIYNPKDTDLRLIDNYLHYLISNCNRFINMQTVFALIFSRPKFKNKLIRLPKSYNIPIGESRDLVDPICNHYIGYPEVRRRFYPDALKMLTQILESEKKIILS